MSIKQNALDALIEYRDAHIAWKRAPPGAAKEATKRERGRLHGKLLEAAEAYKPQHKPER